MIPGIDVSVWQDDNSTSQKMDFSKARAAGARFVFIKVSERGGIDQDFIDNWWAAKNAGIPRGGYHFLRWDLSGLMQGRIFCELLKEDPGELPPVADFEAPMKNGRHSSNTLLLQFLEEVEEILGVRPMIYTSPSFWKSHGRNKKTKRFDDSWQVYPLWIAHYKVKNPTVPKPWTDLTFWQHGVYPDGHEYGAESKRLDHNWFNGNEFDFEHLMQSLRPGGSEAPEKPPASLLASGDIPEYLEKEMQLLGSRIKKIETFLRSFSSEPRER